MKVQGALVFVAAIVATALFGVAASGAPGLAAADGCGGIDSAEALFPAAESVGFDARSGIERLATSAEQGRPCGRWATTYTGHGGAPASSRVEVDVFWSRADALSRWKVIGLRSVELFADGARLATTEQYEVDAAGHVIARESLLISVLGNVFVVSDGRWPSGVSPAIQDEVRIHRRIHAAMHRASAGIARPNDRLLVLDRRAGQYQYWYGPRPRWPWGDALDAFGLPTRFSENGTLCRVSWAESGVTVEFASSRPRPCADEQLDGAEWHGLSLYGERWHDVRGLRVGDTVARVHKMYPRTRFVRSRGKRWLALRWVRNEPRIIRLAVAIRAGRVTSIEVPATWDED
jgi:hypothetical protein